MSDVSRLRVDPVRRVDPETAEPSGENQQELARGHVVRELEPQPPPPHTVPGYHQPAPILEQPPQPKHPDAIARDKALAEGAATFQPVIEQQPATVQPVPDEENK